MAADGGEPPTRIMVAVNESSKVGYPRPSISCMEAFEWVLNKIIRSKSNASGFTILLLHVQAPEKGIDDSDSIYASAADIKSPKHKEVLLGLEFLEYFQKQCRDIGLACEAWVKRGDPRKLICSEVKRVQPDLLVVGCSRRGLSFYQKILIKSVSGHCRKNADCPVAVIKSSV
ncbi:hypothetical protein CASFOL_026428 [Castilleja foliolosa]|uniref:UspA domain-containing protein n=1 Tax=Castilleja foliolosa TaxID=1961234 RepID=A0ABD3CIQ7_9LAMI